MIKSSSSVNQTSCGVVNHATIQNFCDKHNLSFLEPTKMNEIELIHRVNDCKILVVSFGSAFYKNCFYISNKCEKIIVLIIGDEYICQYNRLLDLNQVYKKNKQANIIYHIVDTELNININDFL